MHCNTLQHTATHCNTLHQLITLDNGAGSNVTNRYEIESSVINAVVGGLPTGNHCNRKKKRKRQQPRIHQVTKKHSTGVSYRVRKMRRMPYLHRSLSAKEPYTQRLFCGKRPATEGISCIFSTLYYTLALPPLPQVAKESLRIEWQRSDLAKGVFAKAFAKPRDTFHKRATNYRAVWRKMTYQDKASYASSPPCI